MQKTVLMFSCLADETRLRILNLLTKRELCVCQLMEVLQIGQSKVSRHLAYLRNAGLVKDRRDATWMYYSLAEPQSPLHEQIIHCLGLLARESSGAAQDLLALKGVGNCNELCPADSSGKKRGCGKRLTAAGT